ncbi:Kelch repeat-containing protein [Corallococcus sicarius]|uniref:Kelch repeat-containing protein n=1 Tax=Corallococcus sicarius TaxID=2316726 RepID=UPI001FC96F38|nr:kelch repeat-containing protein [Corallococcus sicarius]
MSLFCDDNVDICEEGGADPAPDGNAILDGGVDEGRPDGGDGGPTDGGDGKPDGGDGGMDGGDGGPPDGGGPELPGWKPVAPMQTRRSSHTATELENGRVLVVGGSTTGTASAGSQTNTTELYTVSSNTWSPGPSLGTARMDHTATRLKDGRVLVVGGRGPSGGALSSAEIYDPVANQWKAASPIPVGARSGHAAVLLSSGKVLVAGGGYSDDDGLNTSALYDPINDTWTNAGNLNAKRNGLTLTLQGIDWVLAIGGYNASGAEPTAELYTDSHPEGGWQLIAEQMVHGRAGHASTLLPSGKVLVTGSLEGSPGTVLRAVDLFDLGTASWTPQALMKEARFIHTATDLPSDELLVTGGYSTPYAKPRASAEILRRNGVWELIAPMTSTRAFHTATKLKSGSVLIIGGTDGGAALNTADRYVP